MGRKGGDLMEKRRPDIDDLIFGEEEYEISQR